MKVKDLIEYLMDGQFKEDDEICFLVGDPREGKRLIWHPVNEIGIVDSERPVILFEIELEGAEPMDEEAE